MEQIHTTHLNPSHTFTRNTVWNIGTVLVDFATLALILSRTIADPDLWGHLRFGLDIIQAGTVIQVDPYSYLTTGQRWINHEWLAEVLFALAWTAGRTVGLILLKMTVGFLTIGILYRHLRTMQIRPIRAKILLLFIGFSLVIGFSSLLRPQIFTFLFFALILLIIRRAETGEYRWLWAAPPILILWTSLHGGFLAGLGLLCLWALMHIVVHKQALLRIIPPILVSIAATLVNPYGMDLLTFLLRTATVQRPEITEWQPLELISIPGFLYMLVLMVSSAGLALSSQPRRPVLLTLFGINALLPLMAVRHLPLFCIASLVFTSEHVASTWNSVRPPKPDEDPPPVWITGLPIALAVTLLVLASTRNPHRIHVPDGEFPVTAVALLKHSGVSGNLATYFNWGEYIIWHLGARIKVSIDGRRETIYSPPIYQQYMHFQYGVKDWDALLRQERADMALVERQSTVHNLLKLKPDWLTVYEDSKSALLVNRNSSLVAPLRQAVATFIPPEANRYFP